MMPSPGVIEAVWLLGAAFRFEAGLIGDWRIVPWREWWRRRRAHGRAWRLYP